MTAFLEAILAPANLWLTALLLMCCLYWAVVIVTGLGPDALDVDLDADGGDADIDADLDADAADLDGHGGHVPDGDADLDTAPAAGGGGTLYALLRLFNIGDVPLMIVVTAIVLVMWATSVVLHPLVGGWSLLWQLLLIVPIFAFATLVMKVVTHPVKRFYRGLKQTDMPLIDRLELVGKMCRVTTSRVTPTFGQAEYRSEGAPVLLNVRTQDSQTLTRGQEAVIVGRDDKSGVYIVRAF